MDHDGVLEQLHRKAHENAVLASRIFNGTHLTYTGGSGKRWSFVAESIGINTAVYLESGDVVAYKLPMRKGDEFTYFRPLVLKLTNDTPLEILKHEWEPMKQRESSLYAYKHNCTELFKYVAQDRPTACFEIRNWLVRNGHTDLLGQWYDDGRPLWVNGVLTTDRMVRSGDLKVEELQGRLF